MIEDSLFVLLIVDEEIFRVLKISPHLSLGWGVFVEPGQVGGNTGMKAWNNLVKNNFFLTYILPIIAVGITPGPSKAVLLINHLPDGWAIIVGEWLNISVKIKILTPIVFFILDMPHPAHLWNVLLSLLFLLQFIVELHIELMLYLIGLYPVCGNVLFVTPTNSTTFRLAYLCSNIQLTFSVQVGPECSKILCLDEWVQNVVCFTIDLVQGRLLFLRIQEHEYCKNYDYTEVNFKHAEWNALRLRRHFLCSRFYYL